MRGFNKSVFVSLGVAVLFGAVVAPIATVPTKATALSGSEFKAGRIIDDAIFFNASNMTQSQIQEFMNAKVPICDTNGTQTIYDSAYGDTVTRKVYSERRGVTTPFTCLKDFRQDTGSKNPEDSLCNGFTAGNKSSAQIIYEVAQSCGVSPKVLLVLLQKEQSLVTDDWPWPVQYRSATGYGCPDTAPCDAEYYGFFNQVYMAARVYKYYAKYPNDFNHIAGRNNYVLYNPNTACGGTNVYIENQATAGLYNYTPYQPNAAALSNLYGTGDSCSAYGNRNFWRMFNDWFGSTQYPQPIGGTLYYQTSTGKIYLVTSANNTRYYVPSWAMLQNYRLDGYGLIPASDSTLQLYADGGPLTSMIWNDNGVFLVNDGIKYHVPNGTICADWALACFDNTVTKRLGDSFQDSHLRTGTTLSSLASYGSVFYRMKSGTRQPIANTATMSSLGYTPQAALYLTQANVTQPLGNLVITTPTPIAFGNGVYYFDGINYHAFPDYAHIVAWGISSFFVPPVSTYNTTPPPVGPVITKWYQDGSGNKYLIDSRQKILLDAQQQLLWPSAQYQTFTSVLAQKLTSTTLKKFVWADPYVYMIENGEKHRVPTYDDVISLGINSTNTSVITKLTMDGLTLGSDALGDGKVVALLGDPKIYVVNNHKLIHIPNASIFDSFGFNWGKIYQYPSSVSTDYPTVGDLDQTKTPDGSYHYFYGSTRLIISSSQAASFGLTTAPYESLSVGTSKHMRAGQQVTKFFYNRDDGKIYYGSGGALHYVSSYEAYVGYGGTTTPSTVVNTTFINGFKLAQPI